MEQTAQPMVERPTLEGVWRDCSVDFKGQIGGKYYLYMIQNNLSRWPKVEVVEYTSFANLRPMLERIFGVLAIREKIIHNGGRPYNRQE